MDNTISTWKITVNTYSEINYHNQVSWWGKG